MKARKSARPDKIAYVPINDEDLAPYEPPVKNKHKVLKIYRYYVWECCLLQQVRLMQEYHIIIQINFLKEQRSME
mgnify:CR=1 FL=1